MSEGVEESGRLTRYPVGSLRELWVMSYPLMLMAFSTYAMVFADRLIVSRYSLDAMNAVGMVIMVFETFHFGVLMLALIAEVFVGQYNGAGKEKRIGEPVWQMVWFSVGTLLVFWPCGMYIGEYVLQEQFYEHGLVYYKVLMLFGPLPAMVGALSAFYVGRGKTGLVTLVVVLGNVVNLGLDVLFIFGVEGLWEPMGTKGAALATGMAMSMQALVLMVVFLRRKNRERYGTGDCRFKWGAFKKIFAVGWPNAVSMNIGIAAWVVFFRWVGEYGFLYLTTLIICQSYFYVFMIIMEGMGKATSAICANLMGADRHDDVRKVLLSCVKLVGIFGCVLAVPLVIFPGPSVDIFVGGNVDAEVLPGLKLMAEGALLWMWLVFFCFGMFWVFNSQLTAAGDTKFIMCLNMLSAWLFLVMPAYVCLKWLGMDPSVSWKLMVLSNLVASILFYLRYRSGKWRRGVLIS